MPSLKARLDATQSKLSVLYAKQGRSQQFTTQAARDQFLAGEIKSLKAYEKQQQKHIDALRKDVANARTQLEEASERTREHARNEDERRENIRRMAEESAELRKNIDGMQEHRKQVLLSFR